MSEIRAPDLPICKIFNRLAYLNLPFLTKYLNPGVAPVQIYPVQVGSMSLIWTSLPNGSVAVIVMFLTSDWSFHVIRMLVELRVSILSPTIELSSLSTSVVWTSDVVVVIIDVETYDVVVVCSCVVVSTGCDSVVVTISVVVSPEIQSGQGADHNCDFFWHVIVVGLSIGSNSPVRQETSHVDFFLYPFEQLMLKSDL